MQARVPKNRWHIGWKSDLFVPISFLSAPGLRGAGLAHHSALPNECLRALRTHNYGLPPCMGKTAPPETPLGGPIGPQIGQLGPFGPRNRTPHAFLVRSAPRSAKSDGNPAIYGHVLGVGRQASSPRTQKFAFSEPLSPLLPGGGSKPKPRARGLGPGPGA